MTATRARRRDGSPGRWSAFRRIPLTVHAAAILFAATMVGFLVLYPTFYGFDEPQHVDRIYATSDGDLLPDPGELYASQGIANGQNFYVRAWPYTPDHSYVDETEPPRGERPSLIDLGGHSTQFPGGYSNQLSEHPPGYYWLFGGIAWLVPDDAAAPLDVYVFALRSLNILLLVPLPYLVWSGVRKLAGDGAAAQTAAFVPVLIPGLGRVGASVNNDNLMILASTALLAYLAGVMKGDFSLRTGRRVALLVALALLTKGTALVLPPVVVAAYVVGWAKARGRAPWGAFSIAVLGCVLGTLWWVANLVRFDAVRPNGYGNRLERIQGPPRAPDDPADADLFIDYLQHNLPERFWGGLGLIEPPVLPGWTITALGWFLVGTLVVTLLLAAGNRIPVLVLTVGLVAMLGLMIANSWSYYQDFTVIPGVQGRYGYPFVLAIAAVIGLGVSIVLGPLRRVAPLVVLAMALTAEYLAADVVVAHIWLPTGQLPRPGNARLAFDTIARFAPFSPAVTASLIGLVGLGVLASIVLAVIGVVRRPRAEPDLVLDDAAPVERIPDAPAIA